MSPCCALHAHLPPRGHGTAETVSTFDIRLKEPNREDTLSNGAIHTIEHLGATFLRNDPEWKDKIVYFGPMGCLTGCYLLVHGNLSSRDVLDNPAEANLVYPALRQAFAERPRSQKHAWDETKACRFWYNTQCCERP